MDQTTKYKNSIDCLVKVVKNEGIKGLYKGFSASLLGLTESTLQFVIYEKLKKELKDSGSSSYGGTFCAAAVAKLSAAIVTYPHEVSYIIL